MFSAASKNALNSRIVITTITVITFVILYSLFGFSGTPDSSDPENPESDALDSYLLSFEFRPQNPIDNGSLSSISDQSEPDPRIMHLYRSQVSQRQELLQTVPDALDFYVLYNVLVPEVFCKNLVRIGNVTDGGKWVCNPLSVASKNECTVYSLGTSNDPSFEESFQKFTSNTCRLRSVDKDEQDEDTLVRISVSNGQFLKAYVTAKTDAEKDEYSFKDLLAHFNDGKIDILKIDIEGAEFLILEELLSVPICQILIEIHSKSARKTLKFLNILSKHGFYLYSYEINGAFLHLSEYSFIHESCLQTYGVTSVYGRYLS